MKKKMVILLTVLAICTSGCANKINYSNTTENFKGKLEITKHPEELKFKRKELDKLPNYDSTSDESWQVDLRSYDLSKLDLSNRFNDLIYSDFDSKTKWPSNLPEGFDPEKIMELGKNPGLQIKKIHNKGITGKGVGIAIIDSILLVDHIEYKDNLKHYEEINSTSKKAEMHGSAVTSIAVGKTVGVAPNADLYYISAEPGDYKFFKFKYNFRWITEAIHRILGINKSLPEDKKIRVISISVGWTKEQKGYEEVTRAVEEAKKQGVFVVSSSLIDSYGYFFNGLGRNPLENPDEFNSYTPGSWWAEKFYNNEFYSSIEKKFDKKIEQVLLVPMDSRATASPTGINDYVFYRDGGWSWSIPYTAGLYALACEVKPDITPEIFWEEALKTGEAIQVKNQGKEYNLGKIINIEKLINNLEGLNLR